MVGMAMMGGYRSIWRSILRFNGMAQTEVLAGKQFNGLLHGAKNGKGGQVIIIVLNYRASK